MTNLQPKRSRIQTQADYGIPSGEEGMLAWDHVLEQLHAAHNYWLVTANAEGKPHVVPVWGVWVEGTLHFGMGRDTRKARNLAANPQVAIHLDSSEDVVIVEGMAEEVMDPAQHMRIDDAYEAKYDIRHGTPVFALRPTLAFAWNSGDYPLSTTRWTFAGR